MKKSTMQEQVNQFIKRNGTKMSTAKLLIQKLGTGEFLQVCEHPSLRLAAYVLTQPKPGVVQIGLLLPSGSGGEDNCAFDWTREVKESEFTAALLTEMLSSRHPHEFGDGFQCSVVVDLIDANGVTVAAFTVQTRLPYQQSRAWVEGLTTRIIHSV